jgi:uncharacterized protein (TIGR01319 family)
MNGYITLIDFGSTYTKGVIVDPATECIVAQDRVPSTVETNICEGLDNLLTNMGKQLSLEAVNASKKLACSSAAGGLRIAIIGLIPELTLEAGRKTAYNAGGKIIGSFSGDLTPNDLKEILFIKPDLLLLSGGTDGGNSQVLLSNAQKLAALNYHNPIIVAGNKSVSSSAVEILQAAGHEAILTENVMPEIGTLNTEPGRRVIRRLFIDRIIVAKGIAQAQSTVSVVMPTPDAVLRSVELIAHGTRQESGLGDLMAVDLGGATTDVYSVGGGAPSSANIILKDILPEPVIKRTVEGDLGMRHNAVTILDTVGVSSLTELAGLDPIKEDEVEIYCRTVAPEHIADGDFEIAIDSALAKSAIRLAVGRHVGFLKLAYLPGVGETYFQTGKNMSESNLLIGTGGQIIHAQNVRDMLRPALWTPRAPQILNPKNPKLMLDAHYLLYAIGLLSDCYPTLALHIAKKYLKEV